MEENINCLLVAEGVSSNACKGLKLGYVVIDFRIFHFELRQVVPGPLLALTISELIEELGLKSLPNVRYILSDGVQSVNPCSYGSGPFGDFGSVHECECQGHFTNW